MRNGPEKMLAMFRDRARWRRLTLLLSLPLALSMIVAACAGTEPTPRPPSTGAPQPTATQPPTLSGDVTVDGSSTVFPITEAVAEEFLSIAPRVRTTVAISGTGGGFKRFCSGETDISNASRPIKESEEQRCTDSGINWIAVPVAIDGLAVIVNAENDFVDSLTVEELERIWKPGSEVTRWNQVRPQWPDQAIKLFGPGTDSGTFDYFTDVINGEEGASRSDYTASEDDNVLVQGVAGERYSLGYFGYAYYSENADKLKVLGIDPGDGNAVVPNDQSINNGTYSPLSRPLFIYINIKSLQDKPQVRAFVETYLQEAMRLVPEVGYVPLPQAEYQQGLTQVRSPSPQTSMAMASPTARPTQPPTLSGDITIDGSSTVFPITEAVAEEFLSIAPRVRTTVAISGTGGGFKRFCSGETDISNASRPIKESEEQRCTDSGINWIAVPVAIDGLAVIVNAENDFVDSLTVEELERIWEPGSEVNRWNQVRPQWPDQTIKLFGPGTDSGTFDYFTDVINGEEGASRSDYTASEDDNVLVQGVAGERYSLGYFGYAYYSENADKLKVLGIDPGDGNAVVPNDQSINTGTYSPLSRPLFIYINVKSLQDKPQVRAFVETYLQEATRLVPEVGYVPLPQAEYQQGLAQVRSSGS